MCHNGEINTFRGNASRMQIREELFESDLIGADLFVLLSSRFWAQGNFVNEDILGSMEFACKLAGTKVLVVLGHTACGAIKGACDHARLGTLPH